MATASGNGSWLSKGIYQTVYNLATAGTTGSAGRPLAGAGSFAKITVTVSGTGTVAGVGTLIIQGSNNLVSAPGAWSAVHFVSGPAASFNATAVRTGVLLEAPNLLRPFINASTSKSKYKVIFVSSYPFR